MPWRDRGASLGGARGLIESNGLHRIDRTFRQMVSSDEHDDGEPFFLRVLISPPGHWSFMHSKLQVVAIDFPSNTDRIELRDETQTKHNGLRAQ